MALHPIAVFSLKNTIFRLFSMKNPENKFLWIFHHIVSFYRFLQSCLAQMLGQHPYRFPDDAAAGGGADKKDEQTSPFALIGAPVFSFFFEVALSARLPVVLIRFVVSHLLFVSFCLSRHSCASTAWPVAAVWLARGDSTKRRRLLHRRSQTSALGIAYTVSRCDSNRKTLTLLPPRPRRTGIALVLAGYPLVTSVAFNHFSTRPSF